MRSGVVAAVFNDSWFPIYYSKIWRVFAIYSRYLQRFQHAGEKFPHPGQGIYAHKLPAHLGRVGEIFYPISGGFAAAVDTNSLPVKDTFSSIRAWYVFRRSLGV